MVKVWEITIPKLTGKETRRAYVYLPASYRTNPDKRYPVLYMFDGHNVFFDSHATYGKSWGMKEYMDRTKTQMIIAAVECNHSPDHGRLKEYSPYDFSNGHFGEIKGLGEETMDWLIHTFKRQIDRRFRTLADRDHTFIAGSSMGGLMSLYALIRHNDVFSRAAALSPSLWTAPERLHTLIGQAHLDPYTILYMDYGSQEMGNHQDMLDGMASFTSQLMRRGVLLESRIVPGGEHSEACWEYQIPFFMKTLTYGLEKEMNQGITVSGKKNWFKNLWK